MRESRVAPARRTTIYMAVSLAVTASGLLLCYPLVHASPVEGQTMNAVLAERFADGFVLGRPPAGPLVCHRHPRLRDGHPRGSRADGLFQRATRMASMATDPWLPHRFSHLGSSQPAKWWDSAGEPEGPTGRVISSSTSAALLCCSILAGMIESFARPAG